MDKDKGNKNILLDFYEGAYGPTIRIDVQSEEDLLRVKDAFLKLSQKLDEEIDITTLNGIKNLGLNKFILMTIPESQEAEKKLYLIKKDELSEFLWKSSVINWKRIVSLIERLIEQNKPGHQYLTEEGIDDAIVELAYLEYRP